MAGYIRQSVADILNGLEVKAPPLNSEFNQIAAAFDGTIGHGHTGGLGDAPPIPLNTSVSGYLLPENGGVGGRNNSDTVTPTASNDTTQGYAPGSMWLNSTTGRVYLCVDATAAAAVWREVVQVRDGNAVVPATTAVVDLGSTGSRFRHLYLSGLINATAGATFGADVAMGGNKVTGLGTPSAGADATTKAYVDSIFSNLTSAQISAAAAAASETAAADSEAAAATSETNAAASEAAAAASEAAAATSEANAAASEAGAATSEANAAASESAAATSEANAAASETAAATSASIASDAKDQTLAAFDSFDDRYLGSFAVAPTLDNDGNPIVTGALYFDTAETAMYVYGGAGDGWVPAYVSSLHLLRKNLATAANQILVSDGVESWGTVTLSPTLVSLIGAADQATARAAIDAAQSPLDEDDFASDSASRPPSQQSTAAYIADQLNGVADRFSPSASVVQADIDTLVESGIYLVDTGTTLNLPAITGLTDYDASVTVTAISGQVSQILIATTGNILHRVDDGTGWGSWFSVIDSADINVTVAGISTANVFTATQTIAASGEGGQLTLKETGSGKIGHLDMIAASNIVRILNPMDGAGVTAYEFPTNAATKGPNSVIRVSDLGLAVPAGVVLNFAADYVPSGWLECNGAAISRTTYAALFAAIGTTHGAGDGSTTFNIPDLRGLFVRGKDNGRGLDPGRSFGSYQQDEFQNHFHQFNYYDQALTGGTGARTDQINLGPNASRWDRTVWPTNTGSHGNPRAGNETRPKNLSLLYVIKY